MTETLIEEGRLLVVDLETGVSLNIRHAISSTTVPLPRQPTWPGTAAMGRTVSESPPVADTGHVSDEDGPPARRSEGEKMM